MKIFGFAGWSGSGKTTLVKVVIPALIAQGLKVSTIKHTHHNFDIDKPGKDSFEHRVAGAHEVGHYRCGALGVAAREPWRA